MKECDDDDDDDFCPTHLSPDAAALQEISDAHNYTHLHSKHFICFLLSITIQVKLSDALHFCFADRIKSVYQIRLGTYSACVD